MSTQPRYATLTYDEIREWAIELRMFTASDLAYAMGVDHDTATYAVIALCADGICHDTGDELDGPRGYERVIAYTPLPPAPTRREASAPDPVQQAISQAGRIVVQRGTPVRIRSERDTRKSLSTPGARQKHKSRQREYDRQQAAKTARAEKRKQRNAK